MPRTRRAIRWAGLAGALLFVSATALAAGAGLFRPGNGITRLDLLGDRTPAMVVVGRRENYNAHSFDVATVYVRIDRRWEIVPVFGSAKGEPEQDLLTASGGADCLLHDFRFFRSAPHAPLELVVAERDYGDSFVDTRPVTFRSYALIRNADGSAGDPTWRFELRSMRTSAKPYCDVGEAFKAEPAWRRARPD